nr:hypothetical protein [Tanacetum cinerariifolium]
MGRDTIHLENAVSTISQEYLLEFTSEYGIPESLHPEFPGPEDPIVEFPEGKVGVYTLLPIPPRYGGHGHDVKILVDTCRHREVTARFCDEDPPLVTTERGDEAPAEVIPESGLGKEVAAIGPVVNKRRRKRGNEGVEATPHVGLNLLLILVIFLLLAFGVYVVEEIKEKH